MWHGVGMPSPKSPIRWSEVLERKPESTLPFLHFYRDAGLIPESRPGGPPPFVRRKPPL